MKYGKMQAAALWGGLLFVSSLWCGVSAAPVVPDAVTEVPEAVAAQDKAAADTAQQSVSASAWLVSDVWTMPSPAFRTDKNIKGEAFDTPRMLALPGVDMEKLAMSRPTDGAALRQGAGALYWHEATGDPTGTPVAERATTAAAGKAVPASETVAAKAVDTAAIGWRYYCTYLTADRFVKAEYSLRFAPVYELYIDGKKVLTQGAAQTVADTARPAAKTYKGDVEPGLHVLIVRALVAEAVATGGQTVVPAAQTAAALPELTVKAAVDASLTLSAQPQERYDLPHYLFGERIASPKLSADGRYYAMAHTVAKADRSGYERWLSVGRTDNGQVSAVYENISNFAFAPAAPYFGYMQRSGKQTRIYAGVIGESARQVYETSDELSGFTWAPDGSFMVVGVTTRPEAGKTGLQSLSSPANQWPYYNDRTLLYKLDLRSWQADLAAARKAGRFTRKNGTENSWLEPLTYGSLSTDLQDISADGGKLLFSTSEMVDSVRVYMLQRMYLMDLNTRETELLWQTVQFSSGAAFSPDGKKLFVVGSESMFADPAFVNSRQPGDSLYVNDYNNKPFIFDLATKQAHFIGRDFTPSIDWFSFEPSGRCVYMRATEGDAVNLYAYRMESGYDKPVFVRVPLKTTNTESVAMGGDLMLYTGTTASEPIRAYLSKGPLSNPQARRSETLLLDPQQELAAKGVAVNHWFDLKFATPAGDSIHGTLYLPDGLTLEELQAGTRQYPCITYYYGGTSPTPKSLDMRYPKQVWASHGYVVLVLQPSGAIGYGSEFAARHINNWGKTVGGEIMAAVRQACERYPFIDAGKIGCIGASYGGFMTQYLVSHCDLFAAAVSHAGISSISSYWGEGYWGYIYNAVAAANAFPWNRRDVYVDQSPLFNADKVHTPLLLLHGTSDHNVPIGESYQMYKALRLLGRPVAMVTVEGEDHGIVDLPKRILWEKTILAWFDRYLKGEPAWWNELYGE